MIIKCKMCGGNLIITEGSPICECEYCGSMQTIPNADSEKKANLFNRANRLRMNSEFDKASAVYEQIVAEFPEEAEAYWGLCLCSYGIEYVDDPASGKKMPTCHRTLPTSIMEDDNFEQACDNADIVARRVYREEAKVIDRIQKDILEIAAHENLYDVFICYKETTEDGDRTEDSVLAQDIYDTLTEKGLRVFFSRITLEDKLGVQYEPYIYAALSSARVMLAIGTQFEYYDAVWVKNEWSRFLDMMKTDKSKMLIPCFKGLDAYDMPKEFKGLQAQDMGKLGWLQDLTRGILKIISPDQSAVQVQSFNSVNVKNLLKRVKTFLRDKEWAKANEYIERILDEDVECSEAYLYRILLKCGCSTVDELKSLPIVFGGCSDFLDAYEVGNIQQKAELNEIKNSCMKLVQISRLTTTLKEVLKQKRSHAQLKFLFETRYREASNLVASPGRACVAFWSIAPYKDSSSRAEQFAQIYNADRAEKMQASAKAVHETNIKALTKQITNAEQELKNLQAIVSDGNSKVSEKNAAIDLLKRKISSLESNLSQIRGFFNGSKRRTAQKQIDSAQMDLRHAEQELDDLKKQQVTAQQKVARLFLEIAEYQRKFDELEQEKYSANVSCQPLTIEQIIHEFPSDWNPIADGTWNPVIVPHCQMCGFKYKIEQKGHPCPLCGEIL